MSDDPGGHDDGFVARPPARGILGDSPLNHPPPRPAPPAPPFPAPFPADMSLAELSPAEIAPGAAANPAPPEPPAPGEPGLPAFHAVDETTLAALNAMGSNPLLAAAMPVLILAARLRDLTECRDVMALRERAIAELRRFETAGIQAGVTTEQMRVGRYALCATLDDIVLNTPWGRHSIWTARGMTPSVHKENWSDGRFFALLDEMQADSAARLLELELFSACLSLGFAGRYRASPHGYSELNRLRDRLRQTLLRERGLPDRALSSPWRGVADVYRPLSAAAPVWVVGAVLAAALMFLYMGLAYSLSGRTDAVYQGLAGLLPNRPVVIARPAPPPAAPRPAALALQRVSGALAADIAAGFIAVAADGDDGVLIRTRANVFQPGSDALDPAFAPVIDRIAQALEPESGPVQVIGHSDNQPIRTLRFPSNQELSEARARAVMDRLAATAGNDRRLSAEGRGARDPVAGNDSAEGRRQNRRIDILLLAQ